ncbi:uncharacterized protein LOC127565909 [Drosophila albomicans]|uniref:carboxylesterase n=1 Tax=Drosophila albomicans TaxID=7291 RepID=A0A9C6T0T1_DROAB|nr:uncharacterized protein LOC127565909 [Drosophila albomicans]
MTTDYKKTSPVVKTTHGLIRGALVKSIYDDPYYLFDGIPYAKPPLGDLRFQEPQDVAPWEGVLDCLKPREKCLQINKMSLEIEGAEDCLYLNVAAKRLKSEKTLPLMVYIYGGAFHRGDATRRLWSPEYLMREDVVYISIGFRTGPFGFLSFADPAVGIPGNAGLKDCILALKWIHANAGIFNGDVNNITIFGHSSGSMMCQLLSVSPQAAGLFHKYILLAGFSHEMSRLPNIEYRVAQQCGYQGKNIDAQVYEFIKNADPNQLARANILVDEEKIHSSSLVTCTPNVEHYETPNAVILKEPLILQRTAWSNHLPLLVGTTTGEGLGLSPSVVELCKKQPWVLLPRTLIFHADSEQRTQLGKSQLEYFCKTSLDEISDSHFKTLCDIGTQNLMHGLHRLLNARLTYGQAENYLYRFDVESPDFNFARLRYNGKFGAYHAEELSYLFKLPAAFKLDESRSEYSTIFRMVAMFTEFARRSNPNALLTKPQVEWKPIVSKEGQRMCLNISDKLDCLPQPELENLQFYDKLFKQARVELILETYEISLPQGQIKGTKLSTLYDDEYYSFERLPFGKPPLGELRFKAPQPADPWTGVLDCTHYGEKPVQKAMLTGTIDGGEDCLYLNVYAKQLKTKKPLPVMVYIFGGAFTIGEATRELYGPDYLMTKDVILVTLNYRVDCFGFLSLKDPSLDVPGNAGLKDQVLALKWVKKYISYFNGDADNITIFGESAGGCSTHYMMCTEQTRGLFHKAIVMSGSLLNYWSDTPPADFAYRLAKFHGYEGDNVDRQVLDYLRGVEPYKLVNHNLVTPEERRNGFLYPFGPTVEPYVTADCVVPKSQLEMVRDAWTNELPAMLGGVSFEGLFMYPALKANPKSMDTLPQDPHRITPYDVRLVNTDEQILKFSDKLIKLYFGDETPSSKHLMTFLDYYSHKIFWHGMHRTLKARLAYSKAPTYYYRFDFDSPDFNFYRKKFCGDDIKSGVSHADELSYLFRNSQCWKLEKTSGEYLTIQRLVGMWTSFASNSNPNCEEIKHLIWEPSTKDQLQRVINISNEVTIIDLPEYEKLLVWDTLYKPEALF